MISHVDQYGRPLNQYETARINRIASRMLLEGHQPSEIGDALGVPTREVKKHARELLKRWLADADTDYRTKLAQELAKLHDLEREAKRAWRRSRKPAQTRRQVKVLKTVAREPDLFDERTSVEELTVVQEHFEERGQSGDPRFLDAACKCIDMRLKIMGAFKDVNIYANYITSDQMMLFTRAFLDAARQVVDPITLEQLQQKTLQLLPTQADGMMDAEVVEDRV